MNKKKKTILAVASAALAVVVAVGGVLAVHFTRAPKKMQYVTEEVKAKSPDKIKVGIISDCQLPQVEEHLYPWDYMTVTGGLSHLIRAMQYFKAQDVDMIVLNGDVVNAIGDSAAYSAYNKILDYVFGEDRKDMPHIIFPMGNHEFYGGNQEYTYYKATGLPLNARTVINGYSFISISNSRLEKGDEELAKERNVLADGTYNPERIAFLKEQLEISAKAAPEKPIFVFLHMPIDAAIAGGHWATPQYEEIYELLKQYPQAVVFTSHSHYCLSDERSIMQKDFTMINTGTSSYFDFDWIDLESEDSKFYGLTDAELLEGKKDVLKNRDYMIHPEKLGVFRNDDVLNRDHVNNGFMMEIDVKANQFTLQKMNFDTGLSFGEPFKMDKFTKDSFTHTAEQIGQGEHNTFSTKYIKAEPNGKNVTVTFAAADQNTPAKYYFYELENANGKVLPVRFFAQNYILGSNLPYLEQNVLRDLEAGDYTLRVYAVNSFNLKSTDFLSTTFTVD